eukprot:CAMPEP_0181228830 /NCGR_PEP_ID=MMETSP1096-20121128/33562_1 /TAXON_ID=156174 ORGANISM="Chrysochromulina ericina, Strain CCMP281" /NCGR_SAMPLE_ID=MMETSP1096 /ASSEMBLY_ACC=CAM_ASM_000453 /LENGTH=35 /DNA_ID= /DNA_START= /DNA_END= /DNA_ORIENTATION=
MSLVLVRGPVEKDDTCDLAACAAPLDWTDHVNGTW